MVFDLILQLLYLIFTVSVFIGSVGLFLVTRKRLKAIKRNSVLRGRKTYGELKKN